jgi:hypothetical protein
MPNVCIIELLPTLPLGNTATSLPFTDNSTTPDPILNQMNLIYILTSYLFKIHYNIIVPFMCSSWNWSLCFSDLNFTCISHLHVNACEATSLITLIILNWKHKLACYAFFFNYKILSLHTFSYINWPRVTSSVQDHISLQGNAIIL